MTIKSNTLISVRSDEQVLRTAICALAMKRDSVLSKELLTETDLESLARIMLELDAARKSLDIDTLKQKDELLTEINKLNEKLERLSSLKKELESEVARLKQFTAALEAKTKTTEAGPKDPAKAPLSTKRD